jgi:hypothetical protein
MFRWLYALPHLLAEGGAARRDARIRFLKPQIDILGRKLGGNRVIPSPDGRATLLAIGATFAMTLQMSSASSRRKRILADAYGQSVPNSLSSPARSSRSMQPSPFESYMAL